MSRWPRDDVGPTSSLIQSWPAVRWWLFPSMVIWPFSLFSPLLDIIRPIFLFFLPSLILYDQLFLFPLSLILYGRLFFSSAIIQTIFLFSSSMILFIRPIFLFLAFPSFEFSVAETNWHFKWVRQTSTKPVSTYFRQINISLETRARCNKVRWIFFSEIEMFVFDSQPDFQRKSIWRNKIYAVHYSMKSVKYSIHCNRNNQNKKNMSLLLIVDEFYSAPCSSKRGKFEHRPLAMFALDRLLSFRKWSSVGAL